MKKIFLFAVLWLSHLAGNAQQQNNKNSAELLQSLHKLNTLGSVLYIAAHPDDENTRLLSYMANELHLKTTYLSLTRGDGGQNLVGKEQGIALGLIRTQELLAARQTDGAEQMFTRAYDFGYSKNPEETFSFWNHDSILADVVLAIRKARPDIIICRFPTNGDGGHGHHTASAILGEEAFEAAADATKFPEQLSQYPVWKTRRIFFNAWPPEGKEIPTDLLKIDVGAFNPLFGKSYGEIAAESRSNHKSQGFGSARIRGTKIEFLRQLKGDTATANMLEKINTKWTKLNGGAAIEKSIQKIITSFQPMRPDLSVKMLIQLYEQMENLPASTYESQQWKKIKLAELSQIIYHSAGLFLETTSDDYMATADKINAYTSTVLTRYTLPIQINKISFLGFDTIFQKVDLVENQILSCKQKIKLPVGIKASNPYWLENPVVDGLFKLNDHQLIGDPENKSATQVKYDITIAGKNFSFVRPITFKYTDPVRGEVYRPFEILPKVTINFDDKVYMFPNAGSKEFVITVKANTDNCIGKLVLDGVDNYKILFNDQINIAKKGDVQNINVSISPLSNATAAVLQAKVIMDGIIYQQSISRISYDHIPEQFYLTTSSAKLIPLNISGTAKKIGYIPGAGDDVAACLSQVGYDVTILSDALLATESLEKFDAIITGVRAYNTNENLSQYYTKLMKYIEQGGNMIVQYNTNNFVSKVQEKIGPYPFTIGRDRVTDEKAEVRFINKDAMILRQPNAITSADFENWIQERCIYSAKEKDSAYQTVFSMNDGKENPIENSLLMAKYGKGNFVYTGIVFFREMPAGIPGAYRLMANLIALPKNQ